MMSEDAPLGDFIFRKPRTVSLVRCGPRHASIIAASPSDSSGADRAPPRFSYFAEQRAALQKERSERHAAIESRRLERRRKVLRGLPDELRQSAHHGALAAHSWVVDMPDEVAQQRQQARADAHRRLVARALENAIHDMFGRCAGEGAFPASLRTSAHLHAATDTALRLCARVLAGHLPPTIFSVDLPEDANEEYADDGASGESGRRSTESSTPLDQTVTALALSHSVVGALQSADALLARKHARAAAEFDRRRDAVPVNHPVQAAADGAGLRLSLTQRSLVRPPLHCSTAAAAHGRGGAEAEGGGRHLEGAARTVFDVPDTDVWLPVVDCPRAKGVLRAMLSSIGKQLSLLLLLPAARELGVHSTATRRVSDVVVAAVMAALLAVNRPAGTRSNESPDSDLIEDVVDVTEVVATNKSDVEQLLRAERTQRDKALADALRRVADELHFFLSGFDRRRHHDHDSAVGEPADEKGDRVRSGKPRPQLLSLSWRDAQAAHSSRQQTSNDTAASPLLEQRTSGSAVALASTSKRNRFSSRRLVSTSTSAALRRASETSRSHVRPWLSVRLSACGRGGFKGVERDLSPASLRHQLAALRQAGGSNGRSDGAPEAPAAATSGMVSAATAVDRLRAVRAATLPAAPQPWFAVGGVEPPSRATLQTSRFDLQQRSPAVSLALASGTRIAGGPRPPPSTARGARTTNWTL